MTTPITTTADRLMELADHYARSVAKYEGPVKDSADLLAASASREALCSAIKEMAAERDALRLALADIETSTTYSPHREAGTWDEPLAKLIHHHARLLPASAAGAAIDAAMSDRKEG